MTTSIEIGTDQAQLRGVLLQFKEALPAQIDRATVRALNRTAVWLRSRAAKETAAELGIAQKHIRGRLMLLRKATRKRKMALFWGGMNPIPVSRLGTPRQNRRGTRVGRKSYPGAFIATMPTGWTSVFRRKGTARLPIAAVTVKVDDAMERAIEGIETETGQRLIKELRAQINYEVNVRGKR